MGIWVFFRYQFLMWTVSGLYFSWMDIDEIHGDEFKNNVMGDLFFKDLGSPSLLNSDEKGTSLELRNIAGQPY